MEHPPRIWVLTDDKPGNRTQAIGIAEHLPWPYEEKNFAFNRLSRLPNRILGSHRLHADKTSLNQLAPPWPDIAIAAGRRLAPLLRYIKRKNPQCFTTYAMHPQSRLSAFDLVVIPQHDRPPKAKNIIASQGALHALTEAKVQEAASNYTLPSELKPPHLALLVGGNSKSAQYQLQDFHEIGLLASDLATNADASLLVTTSRRTGTRATDQLRLALTAEHELFLWGEQSDNPYHAFLGLADGIIVTGDSMSMCAEACSLGKPVFIYTPRHGRLAPKLRRFHQSLFDKKLAQPLTHGLSFNWQPEAPLNEAARIADIIVERFKSKD